jgi:hypothetical protein
MGLRSALVELLSRGEAPEPDPAELVEVETVPVASGPLAVEALQGAGLDVMALDSFNAATGTYAVQVMVPRRQLAEATALLDGLR